ncbi:hypothetical protein [Flagellimonas myxillae]|uniref:hypothetical protein n=1 Tax=Flagellimonas myxillae TaxID=2942214 RepID=UPI00201EE64A|nr:hypothetical protein [Muricauda myxillae]MCL6268002.1 hypothetical protein [Muricauda myxillae]
MALITKFIPESVFNKEFLILLVSFFLITSCNPKITTALVKDYKTLECDKEVTVFELDEKQPEDAEVLGVLALRDTGFTVKCNYEVVVDKAKLEARKAGGDAIKITMHKKPNFWSTCHRIDATILKLAN